MLPYCYFDIRKLVFAINRILNINISFRYLEVSSINAASHLTEELFGLAVTKVAEEVEEPRNQPVSVLDESANGENVRKMISSLIFT